MARVVFEMNGQRERLIGISKGRMQALLQVCMSHTAPELTLRRRREGQGVNGTPAVASEMTHLQLDPRTVLSLTAAALTHTHTHPFTLNSSFAASHRRKRKQAYIRKKNAENEHATTS